MEINNQNIPKSVTQQKKPYAIWVYMIIGILAGFIFVIFSTWIMGAIYIVLFGDSNADVSVFASIATIIEGLVFFGGIGYGYYLYKNKIRF